MNEHFLKKIHTKFTFDFLLNSCDSNGVEIFFFNIEIKHFTIFTSNTIF